MKRTVFFILFCAFVYNLNAQCTIDPFIQQNYELDAQLLVLREIKNNASDPDYDNPFLEQSRVDGYLEKLSAMYANPQNIVDVDSIFNEFDFHVSQLYLAYNKMSFKVPTTVSWVQTLKDTGQSGVTALDAFLSQYQFSVSNFFDGSSGTTSEGLTRFELTTAYEFLNTYALVDDLQNASTDIASVEDDLVDLGLWCNYTGIPYTVQEYALPPNDLPVSFSNMFKSINSTDTETIFGFYMGICFNPGSYIPDYRYVTVSNDCSTVSYSRTLSTAENELVNVKIYPNPTSNFIHIEGVNTLETVEVYSLAGKKIAVSATTNSQIDVSSLQNGIYFLKLRDDQNRSTVKKFIKQ
ncbi:MAG: T9SS type A sorting domain-containing protein [Bacteroidota bacterium]